MQTNYYFKYSLSTQEEIVKFFNLDQRDPGVTLKSMVDFRSCRDILDPLRVLFLCPNRFKDQCDAEACNKIHFRVKLFKSTQLELGDCSYLETCKHKEMCKYIHYCIDPIDLKLNLSKLQKLSVA